MLGSIERMAIHQIKRQTDLEKRLQLLRRQVYGKNEKVSYQTSKPVSYSESSIAQSLDRSITLPTSDLTYLRQDLLKILTFSSIAVGAQVFLFFVLKNHILNIKFF